MTLICALLAFFLEILSFYPSWADAYNLRGCVSIHDPSRIIKCNNRWYVFGTGPGIIFKWSEDGIVWQSGGSVFPSSPPSWTTNYVPGFTGIFWAPEVIQVSNRFLLYYAVSTWGSQVSAIGLATNQTIDPLSPSYRWVDLGPVITSTNGDPYNCIDPAVEFDDQGNMWLAFGSYWNGIYLVQLNPVTGLRISNNSPIYHLAFNTSIEAPFIFRRGPFYYLFVNWGSCCSGVDSTYHIRVGRATSITGPYIDKNGVDMRNRGGTLFLKSSGKFIGPGHISIFSDGTNEWFSYHFYDADANGSPQLDIRPLHWTEDGWPTFTNKWVAAYTFDDSARDLYGQYSGLMVNRPTRLISPNKGSTVRLNGTSQYINLPIGVGNSATIIVTFRWQGTNFWERVFDFGRGTSKYAFLTPKASTGRLRFAITTNGIQGERILETAAPIPTNAWLQVAVVLTGDQGLLYTNGTLVTSTPIPFSLADIAPTNVWLGRSQFEVDPFFKGEIASVLIYGWALTHAEIQNPKPFITFPANNTQVKPGGVIHFSGLAIDSNGNLIPPSNLTWWAEHFTSNETNLIWGPIQGEQSGYFTFPPNIDTVGWIRISFVAKDKLARASTNSVVLPLTTNHYWTAFYPFDEGAKEIINGYNGTLYRGAYSTNLIYRGHVLRLNSAFLQYAALPMTVSQMKTFSAWINRLSTQTWERIIDFGSNTTRYTYITPLASSGKIRVAATINGPGEEYAVESPSPCPTNKWVHIAAIFTGREALLYIDGELVAVNNAFYLLPEDTKGLRNYLGRSQFVADPYYNGFLDSVFLCSFPASSYMLPISNLKYLWSPPTLFLSWEAIDNFALLRLESLGALENGTVMFPTFDSNGMHVIKITPTNHAEFFRLVRLN